MIEVTLPYPPTINHYFGYAGGRVYLKQKGWDEEKIAEITGSPEYQMRMDAMQLALDAAQTGPQPAGPPSQSNGAQNGQNS